MDFPFPASCSREPVEFCGEDSSAAAAASAAAASAAAAVGGHHGSVLPIQQMVPLDFTYVLYDSGTPHSQLLAYLTFAPVLLGLCLLNGVLLRRDLECVYQAAGLAGSTIINAILKRIIQQPRPHGSAKTGFGMPSDHAQFSFFFLAYFSFWIRFRARMSLAQKRLTIVLMLALGAVVCYSRVHLGVHSLGQVLVGAAVGSLLGSLWGAWGRVCVWTHIYPLLERSAIGRRFCLKDCHALPSGVQSAQQFEYDCYMALRDKERAHAAVQLGQAASPPPGCPAFKKVSPAAAAQTKQE